MHIYFIIALQATLRARRLIVDSAVGIAFDAISAIETPMSDELKGDIVINLMVTPQPSSSAPCPRYVLNRHPPTAEPSRPPFFPLPRPEILNTHLFYPRMLYIHTAPHQIC